MDELMIFGLQLTNFNKFEHLVCKILMFRQRKKLTKLSYKAFVKDSLHQEICHIYQDEITHGRTTTRQSQDNCIDKFVRTKASNMQDYADACFRYLRATGLVHISQSGRSISIDESKYEDVMFILDSLPRTPVFVDDEQSYKQYLFDNNTPNLLTNDLEHLREKIAQIDRNFKACNIKEAKRQFSNIVQKRQQALIAEQVADLKSGVHTQDVLECFSDIKNNNLFDPPLMLEWNTWRALNILNGGNIIANLKFDDNGQPLATARGNQADIVCDYGGFVLTVEATLQSGHKQYEAEGESVLRHLAKIKQEYHKPAFCFFIAPKINESCITYFYALHKIKLSSYQGESVVLPIPLDVFVSMVESASKVHIRPTAENVLRLCKFSLNKALNAKSEAEWFAALTDKALNWLNLD